MPSKHPFTVTSWERTDLLALLCVIFPCIFATFLYGVSGQVWYSVVSIPVLCFLLNFYLHLAVQLNL